MYCNILCGGIYTINMLFSGETNISDKYLLKSETSIIPSKSEVEKIFEEKKNNIKKV